MSRYLTQSLMTIVALGGMLANRDLLAGTWHITKSTDYTYTHMPDSTIGSPAPASRVEHKTVQSTPQYDVRRPEVPSGSRVTLFANFLGQATGCVMLNLQGTSAPCQVVDWKPESVTVELPRLSLLGPKNAEIVVFLPDGRIAKTFRVLLVNQPDILVHDDTVGQPMPPAPAAQPASFAQPVGDASVALGR